MSKLKESEIKEHVENLKKNTLPYRKWHFTFKEVLEISAKSYFDGAIWAKSVIEKE